MRDKDIVAIRQPDGRYILRRWMLAQNVEEWSFIEGYGDTYDEAQTLQVLNQLRVTGDTWILDRPRQPRLVE